MKDSIENLVAPGQETQWLLSSKSAVHIGIKGVMPCITILVHGVNDIGEAFPYQEEGLCVGLNMRLCRQDIVAGGWELPPMKKEGEKFTAEDVNPDPDKVYFQRKPDQGSSSVIPFYWGFREKTARSRTKEPHGQYLDQYGNRIDKRFGKNGGPFANATTNIPDMFGPGFERDQMIEWVDPEDGTHPLENAPPRNYMVLAAQRLAALLRIIRKKSAHEPINIIAHSQGCFVTLLAHAILAKEGAGIKADTIILNNPPYSLEEPFAEKFQTGSEQQTAWAREETLRLIVAEYITQQPADTPPFNALKPFGSVGSKWQHDMRRERDNRGKLYLYFSPDDGTVGLPNIQGIGWWGVYDGMREKLGARFFQRMFASPNGSNPDAPQVGVAPQKFSLHFKWNAGFTFSRKRKITGEELEAPFIPDFGPAQLQNGAIDSAIGVTNTYHKKDKEGILNDETPAQAQARWMNLYGKNSFHSSIVSNAMHSAKSSAYDVSIGVSGILKDNDVVWIDFLRRIADWRTNWWGGSKSPATNEEDPSFPPPHQELVNILDKIIDKCDREIIKGNFDYYCVGGGHPGVLPGFTVACEVGSFPHIVSETIKSKRTKNEQY